MNIKEFILALGISVLVSGCGQDLVVASGAAAEQLADAGSEVTGNNNSIVNTEVNSVASEQGTVASNDVQDSSDNSTTDNSNNSDNSSGEG